VEIRCEQLDRGSLGAVLHSGFRIRIAGQEGVGGRVRIVYSYSYSVFVCGMSIIQHEGKAVYSVFVIRIPYIVCAHFGSPCEACIPYSVFRIRILYFSFEAKSVFRIPYSYSVFQL
jgi:hypothetical protein